MKSKRTDLPAAHIVVTGISIAASLAAAVLAILQLLNVWEQAANMYVPLLGVTNLCQAYLQWKTSRKVAYVCLAAAVFIFACAFVVFFVP